jgi:DNA-binding CsgD family transcriptional regulator
MKIFNITPGVKYAMAERRRQIAKMMSKNPNITHRDLAKILKVTPDTIGRDIKSMTEELNLQSVNDFMLHRERILGEIRTQKLECQSRLERCRAAHQGSRWMQEWSTLIEKECKILGIFTPEKILEAARVNDDTKLSKHERDAAVRAVMENDIIDVSNGLVPK